MSIDAVIERVEWLGDGTAAIHLVPRDARAGPAGQGRMVVLNPPEGFEAAAGTEVWGGDSYLMVGDVRWADRVGYTRLRLVGRGKRLTG